MAVTQNRLSTTLVPDDFIVPDERNRYLDFDYEMGPIALNDTSAGLKYQVWSLTWNGGTNNFTATPETVGSPVNVLNVANVTQCTLAFDQNGHVNIAYTAAGVAKLYWYDTLVAAWVTTTLTNAITPTVCLDDKRSTQLSANDILLFYTKLQVDGSYNLYHKVQRERFLNEYLYKTGVKPYIYKCGMHQGLRVQLGMSQTILA